MFGFRKIIKLLRDYCENASLVGLGYIANQRIHLTERIFWIICILVSAGGSYYIIREYKMSFDSKAISVVIENTRPQDKSQFPAISACEAAKQEMPIKLTQYVQRSRSLNTTNKGPDVSESFLKRVIFHNVYATLRQFSGSQCVGCPKSGYKEIAAAIRHNCTELFENCQWNGKSFNCCDYFLPFQTPNGMCFIMNSIQATERDGPHWLNTEFGWDVGHGELKLQFNAVVEVQLLNTEDLPFNIMKDQLIILSTSGLETELRFRVQSIINDPGVREVSPDIRRCRFLDEVFEDSGNKYYSFNACVAEYLKRMQLAACNCTHYNLIRSKDDNSPSCDFDGIMCLDRRRIMKPVSAIVQPWHTSGVVCNCLPSCTDHEIKVFQRTFEPFLNSTRVYAARIRQEVSMEQFRRQAVRTSLDVVVTIGGILGLFMGASILSGIEIVYFFLIRIFNSRN